MANRNVTRAVRLALIAAGTASVGAFAPGALAQEAELEQIVVTGSRIARQDFESASPIVTVGSELFQQSGSSTVETVLNTLPQFVPSVTSTSNNPSNGGQANIELRGLGTSRTLVLLDGKRIIPANPTGVVDLNMLPASLLQNVEVITGGASAVYGSDAVAGVVNFRLREMEGIEVDGNWGITDRGDGDEWTVGLTGGTKFADGRGKLMGNVTYSERQEVLQGDRRFSEVALDTVPDPEPLGSGTIRQGRFDASTANPTSQAARDAVFGAYGVPAGTVTNSALGFNADGTLFGVNTLANFRGDRNEPLQPAVAPYSYNFAPVNYLQLPLERTTAFGRASFEVNEYFEPYAQVLWADYTADQQLAATPLTGISIPVTNPFVQANPDLSALLASRTNPNANFTWRKRMDEVGPRVSSNEYSVYQATVGTKGDLPFGDGWTYDVYYSQGETDWTEKQQGNISTAATLELVQAADGGAALCGGNGFNPFGIGSVSPECAAYISRDAQNDQTIELTVAEASITGSLFDLPAGALQTAFGVFYKEDTYEYQPDAVLSAGCPFACDIQGFNANQGFEGSTDSTEFYFEALVPLLKDMTGAQALDLSLGYRYADYSTVGGVDSYKAELMWQPVSPLRVRGSYQRAVRAPNLSELFTPQQINFPSIPGGDPCDIGNNPSAAAQALCIAQGINPADLPTYEYGFSQVEGFFSGNTDLSEETADTYAVGVVFSSPFENQWASNLQVSVDWYSIEIEDAITAISANTFIQRCFNDRGANPTFDPNNFYCGYFTRADSGDIIDALEIGRNSGALETSGVDVQVDWRADVGPGSLGVNWIVAYTDSYEITQNAADGISDEYAGFAVGGVATSFPEWKSTFNIGYTLGGWGLNARWRYIDSMQDWNFQDFEVPSVDYFDINMSYAFDEGVMDGLTLRAGIENVSDEDPPFFPSYTQSNTDPSQYDVLGRRYFVGLNYAFGGRK